MMSEVKDIDREMAAELFYYMDGTSHRSDAIISGGYNDRIEVIAFADHREAAAAEERAKIVAWLRGNAMSDRWSALAGQIEAGEHLK